MDKLNKNRMHCTSHFSLPPLANTKALTPPNEQPPNSRTKTGIYFRKIFTCQEVHCYTCVCTYASEVEIKGIQPLNLIQDRLPDVKKIVGFCSILFFP